MLVPLSLGIKMNLVTRSSLLRTSINLSQAALSLSDFWLSDHSRKSIMYLLIVFLPLLGSSGILHFSYVSCNMMFNSMYDYRYNPLPLMNREYL